MCAHLAFKGPPNNNYNVKFHAFKEAPTAIVIFKYLVFKGISNNNFNVQVAYFQQGPSSKFNV